MNAASFNGLGANASPAKNAPRVIVQVWQAAVVAADRAQLFVYNPVGSGFIYEGYNAKFSVGAAVATYAPQYFVGTDILADASAVNSVMYAYASKLQVPPLRAFARDTLIANILVGNQGLAYRAGGTNFQEPGIFNVTLPPGSWFGWSPLANSGETFMELGFIEYLA